MKNSSVLEADAIKNIGSPKGEDIKNLLEWINKVGCFIQARCAGDLNGSEIPYIFAYSKHLAEVSFDIRAGLEAESTN
jgi:hypothetical protein